MIVRQRSIRRRAYARADASPEARSRRRSLGVALRAIAAVGCGGESEEPREASVRGREGTAERLVERVPDERHAADERRVRLPLTVPLDVRRTLGPLLRGTGDPTMRFDRDGSVWRATWTADGPATLRLRASGSEISAVAWGPGANA